MAGQSLRGLRRTEVVVINQENENNTFGRPGATGVARPGTVEQRTEELRERLAGTNFTELGIVSTKLF